MTNIDTALIHECARISWPGRMSDMLMTKAKDAAERWFVGNISFNELKCLKSQPDYDQWHKTTVITLAAALKDYIRDYPPKKKQGIKLNPNRKPYQSEPISAKLVDTFMHQLVKYPAFYDLYGYLHLPIDRIVGDKLKQRWKTLISRQKNILESNVYTITYAEHMMIQDKLWGLVDGEFRDCQRALKRSRIWLNAPLWAARS